MVKLTAKNKFTARRIATLATLTAMSLVMFMVECLFPPLFLPGAKMGLSNIFSLLTLFVLGPVDAIVVVIVRTTLGSLITGNLSTLLYSLSAGLVSILAAIILVYVLYPKISAIAVSVVSAVLHNLTQNVVFCLISSTPQMYSYMPYLALIGVVAGLIVGFAAVLIVKAVPQRILYLMTDKPMSDGKVSAEGQNYCGTMSENIVTEPFDGEQTNAEPIGTSNGQTENNFGFAQQGNTVADCAYESSVQNSVEKQVDDETESRTSAAVIEKQTQVDGSVCGKETISENSLSSKQDGGGDK
ncbi:MAG: Gx transporter family protein [Corallococcus sp.]|nr:Gx transporter family protein [Corallococcus sp.]